MGDPSEENDRDFLKFLARMELFKKPKIILTYTRHHRRTKIETTSSRIRNEQELETSTGNHSAMHEEIKDEISSLVTEKGEANDSDDVQVTRGNLISSAASTSLGYQMVKGQQRKVPKAITPKLDIHVKPLDVPAPATPDIVTKKHRKQMMPSGKWPTEDVNQEPCLTEYSKIEPFTDECPDSNKKTCRRSLSLDMRNLERKDQNKIVVSYTATCLNMDGNSVSKASIPLSQVHEHDPKITKKIHDDKDFGFPRCLLIYHRRKHDKNQVQKKTIKSIQSSSLPNELKGPNTIVMKKLDKPVLEISNHPKSRKESMTFTDEILMKKPDSECNEASAEEERKCQKGEKESLLRQIQLFLSRMQHFQGERKFSQWKGSVMDSIGGAYLAQNVDDSLSSTAFMLFAAKFPREAVRVSSPVEASSSKMRNTRRQRIKRKHNPALLNVLKDYHSKYYSEKKTSKTLDTIDWESVRKAKYADISKAIQIRGMSNNLAARIKNCLNDLVRNFGSTDMEWIRDVPYDIAKEYLLNIYGLGLKSVECIRLLTLRQKAFPIDRNAGRVAVRLGWVPLGQLKEGEEFHLLKKYPKLNSIQMYLWQHLSDLDFSILYELHCHVITFGKVFCTQRNPNCYECPMREECKYFASVLASMHAQDKTSKHPSNSMALKSTGLALMDIEDYGRIVKKKKKVPSLSTELQVYLLPDCHDLLVELESRVLDDPCPYLLAVWTPESLQMDKCIPEDDSVYGTLLIPARTATRGSFPLNGTFFQANEVFADDESSEVPIQIPRASLKNLSSTTLYCGTSMSPICRGMNSVGVQKCFKTGFTCFRGFNKRTREPKPLPVRFHPRSMKYKKGTTMELEENDA